jgi:hypothetical protein
VWLARDDPDKDRSLRRLTKRLETRTLGGNEDTKVLLRKDVYWQCSGDSDLRLPVSDVSEGGWNGRWHAVSAVM